MRIRNREYDREYMRRFRAENPELARERKNATRKKNPAGHYAYNRTWNKTERGRLVMRVHQAVQRALKRGLLVRPAACEWCGREGKPEAAHSDYSKPLDVKWLCRFCHTRWDHYEPKTAWIKADEDDGIGRFLYAK